jgi:uncharacterized Zn-finger protein
MYWMQHSQSSFAFGFFVCAHYGVKLMSKRILEIFIGLIFACHSMAMDPNFWDPYLEEPLFPLYEFSKDQLACDFEFHENEEIPTKVVQELKKPVVQPISPVSSLKINFRKRPLEAKTTNEEPVPKKPKLEEAVEDRSEKSVLSTEKAHLPCRWLSCNETFINEKELDDHVGEVHVKGSDKTICKWRLKDGKVCNANATDRCFLSRHLLSHTNYKAYVCKVAGCNKSFSLLHQLNTHVDSHKEKASYTCSKKGCDRIFESRVYLKNHLAMHDMSEKFVCDVAGCTGEFQRKRNLDSHHNSIHSTNRPFACDFLDCGARFVAKSDLHKHTAVHTDERNYPCTHPGCGKSFIQNAHLKGHLKTHRKKAY